MQNIHQGSQSKAKSNTTNPFARALADAEREQSTYGQQPAVSGANPFGEALARTGGQLPQGDQSSPDQPSSFQQEEMMRQQKKEQLRREHHARVKREEEDAVKLFNSKEEAVKREIEEIRQELKLLGKDMAKLDSEIDKQLFEEVVKPGQDGSYYLNFFHQLKKLIKLLRQRVKSATTWASQMHSKKKKRQSKKPGLEIAGAKHEKTSTVQMMMHNEQGSAYSGGWTTSDKAWTFWSVKTGSYWTLGTAKFWSKNLY